MSNFLSSCFWCYIENFITEPRFCLMLLSLRIFVVLHFTFRSVILEMHFVRGVKSASDWFIFAYECPVVLASFVENLSFLPGGSDGKESACNAGEPGLIPGSGGSPGKGNGYPLQWVLGTPLDRGAWWATVRGIAKS